MESFLRWLYLQLHAAGTAEPTCSGLLALRNVLVCKCLYWEIRSCFVLPVLWLKDSFNAQTSEETVEKTQVREGKQKSWDYFDRSFLKKHFI